MAEPSRAVFLSYASQDAGAARRICDALRAGGVEVWFDQSELRGGEAWDRQIRMKIHDCALFIPVISAHSDARHEGYFRREWRLAVERAGDMAEDFPFLFPVVIDGTREDAARVPDRFREVQWLHLAGGEPSAALVERVQRLLASYGSKPAASAIPGAVPRSPPTSGRRPRLQTWIWVAAAAVVAASAGGYFAFEGRLQGRGVPSAIAPAGAGANAAAVFNPPPHSIAVLPFANMSGDKEQEYFSDGLSEELLNSLARINELQVAARTSSFYFKGEHTELATIARKLNVASILEGSVRRSGHTIRVTAELSNAVTGFHLWSQTYDRDLSDVLKLQTEIADAVAAALKITLLGGAAGKIEAGGTLQPAAFDAYLRGLQLARISSGGEARAEQCRAPIHAFSEAIEHDPNYALAYARRALTQGDCFAFTADWLRQPEIAKDIRADATRAIELAPGLPDGYVALSNLEWGLLNLSAADQACTRALALAPGNSLTLAYCSELASSLGRGDLSIELARRGVAVDPLNAASHRALGTALQDSRRYGEAIAAFRDAIALDPEHAVYARYQLGMALYAAGNLPDALASCAVRADDFYSLVCQAIVYHKLGRLDAAAAAMKRVMEQSGDAGGYQHAEIYAEWGETKTALDALEKAMRLRDTGLYRLRVDASLDSLRKEPRFQAVDRQLNFPVSQDAVAAQ